MVEAAHAHDWERLIRLEKTVATLRNKLARDPARLARGIVDRETPIK